MGPQKPECDRNGKTSEERWEETRRQGVPVPLTAGWGISSRLIKSGKLLLTMVRVDVEQGLSVMLIPPRISVSPRLYRVSWYGTEYRGTKGFSLSKKKKKVKNWLSPKPRHIRLGSVLTFGYYKLCIKWWDNGIGERHEIHARANQKRKSEAKMKMTISRRKWGQQESWQSALFQGQSIRAIVRYWYQIIYITLTAGFDLSCGRFSVFWIRIRILRCYKCPNGAENSQQKFATSEGVVCFLGNIFFFSVVHKKFARQNAC